MYYNEMCNYFLDRIDRCLRLRISREIRICEYEGIGEKKITIMFDCRDTRLHAITIRIYRADIFCLASPSSRGSPSHRGRLSSIASPNHPSLPRVSRPLALAADRGAARSLSLPSDADVAGGPAHPPTSAPRVLRAASRGSPGRVSASFRWPPFIHRNFRNPRTTSNNEVFLFVVEWVRKQCIYRKKKN